jgi:hypothetical protein
MRHDSARLKSYPKKKLFFEKAQVEQFKAEKWLGQKQQVSFG